MTAETATEQTPQSVPTPELKLLNVIEAETGSEETSSGCCGGSCHV